MFSSQLMQAGSVATLEVTDEVAERQQTNGLASTSGRRASGQDFIALGVDDRLTVSTLVRLMHDFSPACASVHGTLALQ